MNHRAAGEGAARRLIGRDGRAKMAGASGGRRYRWAPGKSTTRTPRRRPRHPPSSPPPAAGGGPRPGALGCPWPPAGGRRLLPVPGPFVILGEKPVGRLVVGVPVQRLLQPVKSLDLPADVQQGGPDLVGDLRILGRLLGLGLQQFVGSLESGLLP